MSSGKNEPISLKSAGLQAYRILRDRIAGGALPAGEVLPSEREMAAEFGVARNTIRRVLARLKEEGMIEQPSARERVVADSGAGAGAIAGDIVTLISPCGREALSSVSLDSGTSIVIEAATMRALQAAGRYVLMVDPKHTAADRILHLAKQQPYGAIVFPGGMAREAMEEMIDAFRQGGTYVVCHGDVMEIETADRVVSDHAEGCRLLVDFLARQGRRKLLRIWSLHDESERPPWWRRRDEGYAAGCRENGLTPIPPVYCRSKSLPDDTYAEQMEREVRLLAGYLAEYLLCDDPIDAILVISDGFVAKAAAAVSLLGRVPFKDVAIVGYDNYWSEPWLPTLDRVVPTATVDKRNHLQGEELAKLLEERAAGLLPPEPQCRCIRPSLVVPSRPA